jgi:hypothetical protein
MLAMFTNQERDFLDRIISSSSTKDYAFLSRLPLLSFAKGLKYTAEGLQSKATATAAP